MAMQSLAPSPELDARRGQSMLAMPAQHKRAAAREDAERDLLSCSAPGPKRQRLNEEAEALSAQQASAAGPAQQCQGQRESPASVFNLPTGSIADRFSVTERVLGCGQFGSVRECVDVFTGESLACKTIKKRTSGANVERQHAELRNEVGVMMRLAGHDSLVQLRGVFEDVEQVHLVLDRCHGGELFEEVVRRQRFDEPDAAFLFAEIVRAVSFCHARGVVHRDLKPENMLLTRPLQPGNVAVASLAHPGQPLVKLADFGLGTVLMPGQRVRGVAGSPFYMAPEVLKGEYDFKADVWSLGVVLYILLCGSPPFWGEKDSEVFQAIARGKPDLVSGPWGEVSSEAKNLVKCLLVQDPQRRPSAQKILTHPWLVRHLAPSRKVLAAKKPVAATVSSTVEQALRVF